jgi:hypothetical protein
MDAGVSVVIFIFGASAPCAGVSAIAQPREAAVRRCCVRMIVFIIGPLVLVLARAFA